MYFVDMHIHALSGVDDGARTDNEMYGMIDRAYQAGTRVLCFTPHCAPRYFGFTREKIDISFAKACQYMQNHYPDMQAYLGNELQYAREFPDWIRSGQCRTINGTRYLLLDFSEREKRDSIVRSVRSVLNTGYHPILAHVERYVDLNRDLDRLYELKNSGTLLQMDSQSLTGGFGFMVRMAARRILKEGLIDVISSDAHGVEGRSPDMRDAYNYVVGRYGVHRAEKLFAKNALSIIQGYDIREEF